MIVMPSKFAGPSSLERKEALVCQGSELLIHLRDAMHFGFIGTNQH